MSRVLVRCGIILVLTFAASSARAAECDRACLKGLLTQYVNAIAAHKPESLPLAKTVRFTEDSKELKLGEGVWKTVIGVGTFRQDYLDVKKGVAASHVLLLEDGAQVQYSLVLHVAARKIAGVETLVNRITPTSRFQPDSLGKPLPGMSEPVPAGKRMSREEMIKTVLFYAEGLRIGSFVDAKTPFAKEGYRVENGLFIAGAGCPRANCPGLLTQNIILHPDVKPSVAAVDEEEGIVLLWMNFGDTNSYGPGNALITFEAFKVWGGEIHAVNAFFRTMPKETQRGWETASPFPPLGWAQAQPRSQSQTSSACDRACLTRIADGWFAAIAAQNVKVLTLLMPDGTRSQRDMTTQRTFDMAAAHVFKSGADRKVHEIEATGIVLPLNSLNGWSEFLR